MRGDDLFRKADLVARILGGSLYVKDGPLSILRTHNGPGRADDMRVDVRYNGRLVFRAYQSINYDEPSAPRVEKYAHGVWEDKLDTLHVRAVQKRGVL